MKKIILIFFFMFMCCCFCKSQTMRYFEFSTNCGNGNWRDTTFIAAASNQALIDSVLANIARPMNQRKLINGPIDYGNGGHNHNSNHWFLWHFIPDQWNLVEYAMEACDGCPYSDVDADTAYWIGTLRQFCPWTSQPTREVPNTLGVNDQELETEITIYPNPVLNKLNLQFNSITNNSLTLYDSTGQEMLTLLVSKQNETVDLTELDSGFYFLKIMCENKILIKKIIVSGK